MRSFFVFAGQRSLDYGITVEHCPGYPAPARTVTKTTVPGRSGELAQDEGTFGNAVQPYEVWFYGAVPGGFNPAASWIANWLLGATGYQRLEDSYDPDTYRMALFAGPVDFENWMLRRGRATLEFDCQPQRWLKSGEQPVAVESGQKLYNLWRPAKPLITLTGNGTLTVGGSTVTVTGTSGEVTLDCELQDAYQGSTNLNGSVEVENHAWPVLEPGETQITFAGEISGVKIIPRWWRL